VSIVLPDGEISEIQEFDVRRLRDSLRHFSDPAAQTLDLKLARAADSNEEVELDGAETEALRNALERLSGDPHSQALQFLYRNVAIALRRDARLEQPGRQRDQPMAPLKRQH
jgi:hypothetical protein